MACYPILPGEFGVVDENAAYGTAERFGMLPARRGTVPANNESNGRMFAHRACSNLPGVRGAAAPGGYMGHNTNIWEAFTSVDWDGCWRTSVVHMIAGGNPGEMTGTMVSGSIDAVAVSVAGGPYFVAPKIRYRSTGGSLMLNGAELRPLMKATTVKVLDSLPIWNVNDIVDVQNGIRVKVTAVDASHKITAAIVHTAGSIYDPVANTFCNRYYAGTSPDNATAWFFLGFGIDGGEVVDGGSGGAATVVLYVDPPTVPGVRELGRQEGYGRLGIQCAPDFEIGTYIARSDPAVAFDGNPQPGAHIDYFSSGVIESYVCENTGQVADSKNGWAAFSVDGNARLQAGRVVVKHIEIQRAAFHAVATCADAAFEDFNVHGWGEAATKIADGYFADAVTRASGLICYRGAPYIAPGWTISQNEARMGATARNHITFMSTGLQDPNLTGSPTRDAGNRFSQKEILSSRPATMGGGSLLNVCRGGVMVVDPANQDASNPCVVHGFGTITVQFSAVEPMDAAVLSLDHGGASVSLDQFGIHVHRHVSGAPVCFDGFSYVVLNSNGTRDPSHPEATTKGANFFHAEPDTVTDWGTMEDLRHSNGILALVRNAARGKVKARSDHNLGLPLSRALPVVWLKCPQNGWNVALDVDCKNLHQVGPAWWCDQPGDGEGALVAKNFRNAPVAVLDSPAGKVALRHCIVAGVDGSGIGLQLRGPQTGAGFQNADISLFTTGVGTATGYGGAFACAGAYALGCKTTGTTAIPTSAMAALASPTFAP